MAVIVFDTIPYLTFSNEFSTPFPNPAVGHLIPAPNLDTYKIKLSA